MKIEGDLLCIDNAVIKPVTGSFVNMLISDTGIVNGGLKEWEQDFRLGDKYDMKVFLGGPESISNLHNGDWLKEVDNNKRYYDRTVAKYQHRRWSTAS